MGSEVTTGTKVILAILIIILVGGVSYLVWRLDKFVYNPGDQTLSNNGASTAAALTTQTPTPTAAPNDLVYTNTSCGFTLTFTEKWKGYKFKSIKVEGRTETYYVEVPTSDKTSPWNTDGSTHDAGYASLFALGTYTNNQWIAAQNDPDKPAKIGECSGYTVGYTPAQAYPADIQTKGLASEVKSIVATFKTTK